ncbi:IMP cyclohydrolase [candidate division KSB1 bacterium]|nr:IMP cyclohydrolase [candidate division KSB1 bacterium]
MSNLKKMYSTIRTDHFPATMTIEFGDQKLLYRKKLWQIKDAETQAWVERGLRYGENPDQPAALYELINGNLVLGECQFIEPQRGLVSALQAADLLQFGKHPGKINLTDVDSGLNILKFLMPSPAAVIIKHNNPSGVAMGQNIFDAFEKAFLTDRLAAMGGAVVLNRPMDKVTAEYFSQHYFEVVAAPEYETGTLEILAQSKNLRVIKIARIQRLAEYADIPFVDFKSLLDGGIIVQHSQINHIRQANDFLPATARYQGNDFTMQRQPTATELADMLFGWFVILGVTSNSVIYVKNGVTVGIGTGEQDRVGVAKIAAAKAKEKFADGYCFQSYGIPRYVLELEIKAGKRAVTDLDPILAATTACNGGLKGAVMISDAFFPFRDGVDVGIAEGVTAICQPGGSIRDFEVIQACNAAQPPVTMVFTGQRAFRH